MAEPPEQPELPLGVIQIPETAPGAQSLGHRMNIQTGWANLMRDRLEQVGASVPNLQIDLNQFELQLVWLDGDPHYIRVLAQTIDGRNHRVLRYHNPIGPYGPLEHQPVIAVMRLEPNLFNPIGQEACYLATDALNYGGGPATSVWGIDILLYAHLVTTAAGQRMTNWFADHDVAGAGQAWFEDRCLAFDTEANDIDADLVQFEGQPQMAAIINHCKEGLRQLRRRVAVYRSRVAKFRMLLATGIHIGNPPQPIADSDDESSEGEPYSDSD